MLIRTVPNTPESSRSSNFVNCSNVINNIVTDMKQVLYEITEFNNYVLV